VAPGFTYGPDLWAGRHSPRRPPAIRAEADRIRADEGLAALLAGLDAATAARIDRQNPMRVQRAWEVLHATGRGLATWQDETPPALLPLRAATGLLLVAETPWLDHRIARRFDEMIAGGLLQEVRANLPTWNPAHPSSRAIGARNLVAYLQGKSTLDVAVAAAKMATRQYAKRQRTWFRSKMQHWSAIPLPTENG